MSCFDILGIDPTSDKRAIKKAYAAKSKIVHPEEHPDEFRQLHDAYEQALAMADRGGARSFTPVPHEAHNPQKEESENLFDSVGKYKPSQKSDEPEPPEESESLFDSVGKHKPNTQSEEPEAPEDSGPHMPDLDFDAAISRSDEQHMQEVAAKTEKIIAELENIALYAPERSKPKDIQEWKRVTDSPEFMSCVAEPYFIEALRVFTAERPKLPAVYYTAVIDSLGFKALMSRQQKGIYTDLWNLFVERGMSDGSSAAKPIALAAIPAIAVAVSRGARVASHSTDSDFLWWIAVVALCIGAIVAIIINSPRKGRVKSDRVKAFFAKLNKPFGFQNPLNRLKYGKTHTFKAYGILICFTIGFIGLFIALDLESGGMAAFWLFLICLCILAYYIIFDIIIRITSAIRKKKQNGDK